MCATETAKPPMPRHPYRRECAPWRLRVTTEGNEAVHGQVEGAGYGKWGAAGWRLAVVVLPGVGHPWWAGLVTRSLAIAHAAGYFDSGAFLADLTRRVAFPTE